ncbi:MAG: S26 family signal peptidase [Bdellovibrionales bacterium]|nr:S26 family signal peptidase [Bdellovibrionales bacterium]
MWPTLRSGYRVSYFPVSSHELEPGDVVVIQGRGRSGEPLLLVHRILDRVGPFFLEAGDNSFSATLITPESVLGRVVSAEPPSGASVEVRRVIPSGLRYRAFRQAAHAFVYAHELKDRLVGGVKSPLLWKASVAWRKGLQVLGLQVPVIPPRH